MGCVCGLVMMEEAVRYSVSRRRDDKAWYENESIVKEIGAREWLPYLVGWQTHQ